MNCKVAILVALLSVFSVSKGNAVEVVVNQSVPVQTITLNKIRAIFTMRQKFWPGGEPIKVFTLADQDPIHKKFTKNKLINFKKAKPLWTTTGSKKISEQLLFEAVFSYGF